MLNRQNIIEYDEEIINFLTNGEKAATGNRLPAVGII